MKRILITGATGFVGRHCLEALSSADFEVHAVSSKVMAEPSAGVSWHRADLLDSAQTSMLIARVRPTHLLHCAWYVVPGMWHMSQENYRWVGASLHLLQEFASNGGQRAVFVGSCAEYDWDYGYCSEDLTPLSPQTIYGACKHALQVMFGTFIKEMGLSGAWARIFFLYGPYEHPKRLMPSIICSLLRHEYTQCTEGTQIRDYMHVQDAANALVRLTEGDFIGPVNVASGQAVAIREIVRKIGQQLGLENLVRLGDLATGGNQPPLVVGDVRRLKEVISWEPEYDLDRGIDQIIRWWKDQILSREISR